MNTENYHSQLSALFLNKKDYTDSKNKSYGRGRPNSKVSAEEERYRKARADVLRKLYEENEPNLEYVWILPAGETDGRKSHKEQILEGNEFSPFNIPNLEDMMPNKEDFYGKK